MTKQVIYYGKASAIANDSFNRHIKNALIPQKISHSNFTLSSLHKFFNKNQNFLKISKEKTLNLIFVIISFLIILLYYLNFDLV